MFFKILLMMVVLNGSNLSSASGNLGWFNVTRVLTLMMTTVLTPFQVLQPPGYPQLKGSFLETCNITSVNSNSHLCEYGILCFDSTRDLYYSNVTINLDGLENQRPKSNMRQPLLKELIGNIDNINGIPSLNSEYFSKIIFQDSRSLHYAYKQYCKKEGYMIHSQVPAPDSIVLNGSFKDTCNITETSLERSINYKTIEYMVSCFNYRGKKILSKLALSVYDETQQIIIDEIYNNDGVLDLYYNGISTIMNYRDKNVKMIFVRTCKSDILESSMIKQPEDKEL